MQENTNKTILLNSAIMYARMFINTILTLLITRYALKALGISAYGLFSVVGSIISFMAVFNTIMVSTCNRFMSVAIGKGNKVEINKVFNINFSIFVGCAVILLFVVLPIGDWYVRNYINYDGASSDVLLVFYFSIIGSVISTVAIPFHGLLMSKERFFMFCFVDIAMHILKFGVVIAILYYFEKKLLIYTLAQAATAILPALIYWIYCKITFPDIVRLNIVKDKHAYSEVFRFSGWVSIGAVACVARNQSAALLVNHFFNTMMNTALGIANSLNQYVLMFANNMTQPMQPQITKSYAARNFARTDELLVMSTKMQFLLMLLVGSPFFVNADWILQVWLGQVPPYAVSFTILLIIDNLVTSFNSGLSLMLFADGRIALYQIVINTLRILAVIVAYFVLRTGVEPYFLFIVYITFSLIIVFATQWCLHKTLHYNNTNLMKQSYGPSLLVLLLLLPILFLLPNSLHPILRICVTMIYLMTLMFYIGLNKKERNFIINKLRRKN